jgi:HAD superfamily hydrolase (TIGR01459 family)
MSFWGALDARYRVILCDVWGVVHDGVTLYPNAAERLAGWRSEGRQVVLLTNAPRTAKAVEQQLARIGLPRECWDAICTSGEAGIAALLAVGEPVGFLGTPGDRAVLESREVSFARFDDFRHLACTGLDGERMDVAQYRQDLSVWAERDVTFHCLNPDRVVVRGGVQEPCAGALADQYLAVGGRVEWYGKPHAHIYEHALALAGEPPHRAVLAVGDALRTDVLGAARFGINCVYVAGGIHAGEGFPEHFSVKHGLGAWRPVAVVDGLA